MSGMVLDSSALLALLFDEPGSRRVAEILNGAIISTINLSEVAGHYAKRGAAGPDIRALLDPLPIIAAPFDVELAHAAGLLRPLGEKAGLSLGGRACLALAKARNASALTADKAWRSIAAEYGVEVEYIR